MKYNLSGKKTIETLLKEAGFTFKKSLGQNFLTDPTVCPRMAEASADQNTGVLEIGPGIGVLTAELAQVAKRVVAIELDERLRPVLGKTLEDFDNVKVIFGDAMKLDLKKIIEENFSDCQRVSVCANLPYYITSPIIMMLLESKLPVESITVMVQKEAAERLCAEIPGRDVGAVTLSASYFASGSILFNVSRGCFTPVPNVDSAVIQLKIRKEPPVKLNSEKAFFALVRAAFNHRRKTFINSVSSSGISGKAKIEQALSQVGVSATVRAEELSLEQFAQLTNIIFEK
ncbi:MAG: 16S rRNA (adenine(1518)-N(6)/adenine(1519)-N(6))-dimethyltransferase RsmA [Clostridia bacterium]|nr:16S rRNA (adenine(1518)-N(6)/adenine(1519)-N(6))-dimethyltransferase RsmA [Clostridia bacterium]